MATPLRAVGGLGVGLSAIAFLLGTLVAVAASFVAYNHEWYVVTSTSNTSFSVTTSYGIFDTCIEQVNASRCTSTSVEPVTGGDCSRSASDLAGWWWGIRCAVVAGGAAALLGGVAASGGTQRSVGRTWPSVSLGLSFFALVCFAVSGGLFSEFANRIFCGSACGYLTAVSPGTTGCSEGLAIGYWIFVTACGGGSLLLLLVAVVNAKVQHGLYGVPKEDARGPDAKPSEDGGVDATDDKAASNEPFVDSKPTSA
jgi:hypothetical protein